MPTVIRNVDLAVERHLLTGMIVSDRFIQDIQTIYNPHLVESKYVRTVIKWCLNYWKEYEKAPGYHIQDVYNSMSRQGSMNEDESELIGKFLESISEEYEDSNKINVQYLLDQCKMYFKKRSMIILYENVKVHLDNGDIMEAETALAKYKKVDLPEVNGTNPMTDRDLIYRTFEEYMEPLFTYPGAVGDMINTQMVREGFVAFLGKEKSGKSFTLIDMSIRALAAKCNVAFFATGDMSDTQMTRRISVRLAGKSDREKYCKDVVVPFLDCHFCRDQSCKRHCFEGEGKFPPHDKNTSPHDLAEMLDKKYKPCTVCRGTKDFKPVIGYRLVNFDKPLGWREALKTGTTFMKRMTRAGKGFKLSCHSNMTLRVQDIKNQLDIWEQFEGFVPDVIIIDYADIMGADDPKQDKRAQENERWAKLRGIAQDRHCLVITATQADADSYTKETLGMSNFSEDKRKLSHVTGLIGLNQTPVEKQQKLMRWNWIVLREDDFDVMGVVTILQSLSTGRPCVDSFR